MRRVAAELQHQRVRANGRTLRNVDIGCIEPRRAPYGEGHALFYAPQIEECFGGAASVGEIVGRLGEGSSMWHAQARQALLDSSPLALSLTFELLRRGGDDGVGGTDGLAAEAHACTRGWPRGRRRRR